MKYSSITLSEDQNSTQSGTLPILENHQNVLFFILDSVSPAYIEDSLKNHWLAEEKEWVKDFTYYDNTTTLSLGSTLLSLPNIIGGSNFLLKILYIFSLNKQYNYYRKK